MEQVILYCLTKQIGDWTIRIDSPHGNPPHNRKHVHITKRGLSGEYSWNIDGSRHDEHRFPTTEKCIKGAKKHAASALGIPVPSLSFIVGIPGGTRISIRSNSDQKNSNLPLFNDYVSKRFSLVVFGSSAGLVLVLNENA